MKALNGLLIFTALIGLSSCNPKISTNLIKHYPPLDYKQDIIVLDLDDTVPGNTEELGVVKIGDSGFGVNCGYENVLDEAKLEARKAGGNAIKIIKHKLPSIMGSSCHRITAQILKINNIQSLILPETNKTIINADNAILNIYRYSGPGAMINYDLHLGDTVICRVTNNYKTTIKITKDGLNSLWAKTEAKAEVPVNIKFGKEYFLRCGVTMGAIVGHPKLELIDSKTGKLEFESFKSKNK